MHICPRRTRAFHVYTFRSTPTNTSYASNFSPLYRRAHSDSFDRTLTLTFYRSSPLDTFITIRSYANAMLNAFAPAPTRLSQAKYDTTAPRFRHTVTLVGMFQEFISTFHRFICFERFHFDAFVERSRVLRKECKYSSGNDEQTRRNESRSAKEYVCDASAFVVEAHNWHGGTWLVVLVGMEAREALCLQR